MPNDLHRVTDTRAGLGRVGVWLPPQLTAFDPVAKRETVRRVEGLGYGSLWTGEIVGGTEAISNSAVALAASTSMVIGTGIANMWARHPATLQGAAEALAAGWPGRFLLGIGVSHEPTIATRGLRYDKPLERMASYLAKMDAAALDSPDGSPRFARVLAALRPRMLELARDHADGAHPYFVPPSHTPWAREILGPNRLLIPEQAVVLTTDRDVARRTARKYMAVYLTLPNYVNNLRNLGYGDEDLNARGSDRLVDAIVAWGDEHAIADRISELRSSGADHVVIQPLAHMGSTVFDQLERLAPALVNADSQI